MKCRSPRRPLQRVLICTPILLCLQVVVTISGAAQNRIPEKPLKLDAIEKLMIRIKAPSLVSLIRTRGIDFRVDESTLQRLQNLGASNAVIEALKEFKKPDRDPQKKVAILVADFKAVSVQDRPVTEMLFDQLRSATTEYPDISIRPLGEPVAAQLGEDYAKQKGKERGADIVIWGWYSGAEEKILLNIHFEVLHGPRNLSLSQNMKTFDIPVSDFKGFNLQIQTPLSSQMSYLTLLTLGLARLEAEDFDGAIAAFTKTLSLPSVPDTMVSPTEVYYYRATSHLAKSFIHLADEMDLAIADLNRVIEINPNYADAHRTLGWAYQLKGETEKALGILNKAIALSPDDVLLLLQRGEVYAANGALTSASQDCKHALELLAHADETEPATFFLRWQGHFCTQDFVSAINDATKAIDLQQDKESLPFLLLLRATSYFASDQNEKAINDATQALRLKPDLLPTYQIRAAAYAELENFTPALADANYLVQSSPTNGLVYFIRGEIYREKGDLKESDVDYTRALALDADLGVAYVGRGRVHHVLREYESAIAYFDKALTAKKPDPEGLLYRGLAYQRMKKLDRALSDFNQYISLFPTDENGYSFRADAYDAKGEPDKATEDYSKAIELKGDDSDLFSSRGAIYEKQGETEKALKDYTRAIDLSPTVIKYWSRGTALRRLKNYGAALQDFDKAIAIDPRFPFVWLSRAATRLNFAITNGGMKALDQSIADYSEYIRQQPSGFLGFEGRAIAYKAKGELSKAVDDYTKAIELKPDETDWYLARADIYDKQKALDLAISDLTAVIRLKPSSDLYRKRGIAFTKSYDWGRAIADFENALKLDPIDYNALLGLALAHEANGEFETAMTLYEKCIVLKPADERGYSFRGDAYTTKNNWEHAIQDYTRAIGIRSDNADLYSRRAFAYRTSGQQDPAIADYTEAIRLNPRNPEYTFNRASVYSARKEFSKAVSDLDVAIGLNPKEPRYYFVRGIANLTQNKYDAAIKDLGSAMRLKPDWDAGLLWLGIANARKGDRIHALLYLRKCLRLTTNENNRKQAQEEIDKLHGQRISDPLNNKSAVIGLNPVPVLSGS